MHRLNSQSLIALLLDAEFFAIHSYLIDPLVLTSTTPQLTVLLRIEKTMCFA